MVVVTTTTSPIDIGRGDLVTAKGPIASGTSPLAGMRGVIPGFTLPADFRAAVRSVDANAVDLIAAARAYDLVMLIAISAEGARTDAAGQIAANMIDASRGGRRCENFVSCRRLALTGDDGDYDGLSGAADLLDNGDPSQGEFAVVKYDGTGALRATSELTGQATPPSGRSPEADPHAGPLGDGTLQIGTLLPVDGPDSAAARGALAGARVAVQRINDLGGVVDSAVVLEPDAGGDGSPAAIDQGVTQLIDTHVDAVLGGTTAAITAIALPRLTAAGIVLASPTDTAREWSAADDHGLFFRLAVPDDLEGRMLGRLVIDDGATRVALAVGADSADVELAADVTAAINSAGGKVTTSVPVADTGDMAGVARLLIDSKPQAVVLVTPTAATASLIRVLADQGKGAGTMPTYGTPANMNDDLVRAVGG